MNELTIIIPTFNEQNYICECLDSILIQRNPQFNFNIIISDGMSTDETPQILSEYSEKHENIQVITNTQRKQVFALNQMLKMVETNYVIRCDAHATYDDGYFQTILTFLKNNHDVGNAGTRTINQPGADTLIAKVISLALNSKLGVGNSHRTIKSNEPVDVDTVLFGAWPRDIFEKVGDFDTNFIRGQDLEHNIRVKKQGYRVVKINGPAVNYYTRTTYSKLFKMMMQYASVKPLIIKKHRAFPNARSFIPFAFFCMLLLTSVISVKLSLLIFSLYFSALVIGAFLEYSAHKKSLYNAGPITFSLLPITFLIQHFAHATGMLIGIIASVRLKSINWDSSK